MSDPIQTPIAPQSQESAQKKMGLIQTLKTGLSAPVPEDMDKAAVRKLVFSIAGPAMVESFLLHLASMVDTMMVGVLGTVGIASVGFCNQPRLLLLAIFQAFNVGATALIARAKGAGDPQRANRVMHLSIALSVVASIVLAVVGYIFATPMVTFMGASADTVEGATQYMRFLMIGFPANALSLAITASLRGVGRTRVSMVYNVLANVVNIIGNYLLIQGNLGAPAMGIRGAALGTSIGYIIAAIVAVGSVVHGADMLRLRLGGLFQFDLAILKSVVRIGFPSMFEQFFMRFGQIIFNKVVASLGTDAYACHQIVNNIWQMTMTNGQSFGISATSLLGQSLGRKRPDQGKAAVSLCRRYAFWISVALGGCLMVFGKPLMHLYTDSADVIAMGAQLMILVMILQPLQSSQQVVSGALRGAGDTKAVAIVIFLGIVVLRPLLAYSLVYGLNLGLVGVWLSVVGDQTLRSSFTLYRYATGKWKTIKV